MIESDAWNELDGELQRWRSAGRTATFWWRDDDATRGSPELARLVGLAQRHGVPLALAVVPQNVEPALFARIEGDVCVLQHGVDHRNRAAPGAKRSEFTSAEPDAQALARIGEGRARLAGLAGERWLPAFAPPWNRVPASLAARLPQAGLNGLSAYGPRAQARPAPGLVQVNAHVDLVAWRGDRGFVGAPLALAQLVQHLAARRDGAADAEEPTGLLTHHLQHDAAAWRFLDRLLETLRDHPAARWPDPRRLFAAGVH